MITKRIKIKAKINPFFNTLCSNQDLNQSLFTNLFVSCYLFDKKHLSTKRYINSCLKKWKNKTIENENALFLLQNK